jgi:hypothetical protein
MQTSRRFQQLSHWINIHAHNCRFLRSKLKVFTLEHGDASSSEPVVVAETEGQ